MYIYYISIYEEFVSTVQVMNIETKEVLMQHDFDLAIWGIG